MEIYSVVEYYGKERLDVLAAHALFYATKFNDAKAAQLSRTILARRDVYTNPKIMYDDLQMFYPDYNQPWFWTKILLLRIVEEYAID